MKASGRLWEAARRRLKALALKSGAVAARRLLHRKFVRRELSRAPEDSGLQPIPGDKGLPVLGHALAATLGIEFLESRLDIYGEISWMRGFGTPFVLALGPKAAEQVFANNDHVFSQKGAELFLGPFFKRGLMLLDFEEHHFHRQIMQQAFTRERLGSYLHSMDTIGRAAAAALGDEELLVYPYLKRTLLDIATVVFMGGQPGPQGDLMNKAFTDCLRAAGAVVRFPFLACAGRQVCAVGARSRTISTPTSTRAGPLAATTSSRHFAASATRTAISSPTTTSSTT